jgi:hypothetical protein
MLLPLSLQLPATHPLSPPGFPLARALVLAAGGCHALRSCACSVAAPLPSFCTAPRHSKFRPGARLTRGRCLHCLGRYRETLQYAAGCGARALAEEQAWWCGGGGHAAWAAPMAPLLCARPTRRVATSAAGGPAVDASGPRGGARRQTAKAAGEASMRRAGMLAVVEAAAYRWPVALLQGGGVGDCLEALQAAMASSSRRLPPPPTPSTLPLMTTSYCASMLRCARNG